MIAYISGKITHKSPTQIYLDVNGLGYEVNISLNTYAQIEYLNEVKLWTFLHIREDAHTLFGFFDEKEKRVFLHLISVSGIGTNTARLILSGLKPDEAIHAIANDQSIIFSKVKGIGPKTAKRIILDLRDKMMKEDLSTDPFSGMTDNTIIEEALSALVSLGFQRARLQKLTEKEYKSGQSVEDLIKIVLKQVSG